MPKVSTLAILIRQRKSPRKCRFGIPRINFPEFPGSAFFLGIPTSLIGNPEFPGIFRHLLGEGFWVLRTAFSKEDAVDILASGEYLAFFFD